MTLPGREGVPGRPDSLGSPTDGMWVRGRAVRGRALRRQNGGSRVCILEKQRRTTNGSRLEARKAAPTKASTCSHLPPAEILDLFYSTAPHSCLEKLMDSSFKRLEKPKIRKRRKTTKEHLINQFVK